ncbi:MAG: HAMP domain-containing protein [Chloroflexi bacterium]|nr:HAMP domain-containing protein [Chloroflexota bacterium]MCL5276003.1 HAMP domain-containing protein [Chloroflexota bacterium]
MKSVLSSKLDQFWAFAGGVSIRAKILGIVLALVALLGIGITLQVRAVLSRTMDTQLREQSVSISRDLAARSTDLILINDLYALQQLLLDTQSNNANVRYAFIIDNQNHILAHTFGQGFPPELLSANSVSVTEHHHTLTLDTDEGVVWDTAVPIFGGQAGTARVGLSEANVRRSVDAVTGQLLLTTLAVSVVGISAAAFLTWLLTRPILNLVQAANAIGNGDFTQRVKRWADDEVGALSEAFNNMSSALARAQEERVERDQLRAQYVSGVIGAQEEERKRIARELHDSTSQSLTSLLLGLRTLADGCDPAMQQRVNELRTVAARTLDDVHNLALQLRPSVLDDLGLPAAIQRYVDDCRSRYPLRIDLAVRGLDQQRLPANMETALYRIIQESITNVVRHANAQTASVLIECHNGVVRAVIEDDGCGFDPSAVELRQPHLGLYGIRERAELLGGKVVIESAPGQGTSLFIAIPCRC